MNWFWELLRASCSFFLHNFGEKLKVETRVMLKYTSLIRRVVVRKNLVVSCSDDQTNDVWDKSNFSQLTTLRV